MAKARLKQGELAKRIAAQTDASPAVVKSVLDQLVQTIGTLGNGDRVALGKNATLICRVRDKDGASKRVVAVRMRDKTKAGGQEAEAE